ncbi:hypothetical protein ES708_13072 [subsurface metagenome]
MPPHDGGGALRLEAHHLWFDFRFARLVVLLKALPVGGDVAGVAHGDEEMVGSFTQIIDNLEGSCFLPLDTVGVERVDQRDGVLLGESEHYLQSLVEVAVDSHDFSPVDNRLSHLAQRNLAFGDNDYGFDAVARGISRRRGAGVARGSAHQSPAALFQRLSHRHHHTPVLERAGGVAALQLEIKLADSQFFLQLSAPHQRGVPLAQSKEGRLGGEGEEVFVSK